MLAAIFLAGCHGTESDWKRAKDDNTVAAYTQFVTEHPQGPHADEAQAAIEQLDWAAAKGANSISGYDDFLKKHQTGQFAEIAKTALLELRWADAKQKETVQSYQSFLNAYPSSPYSSEANARIAALSMTKADSISITDGGQGDLMYGKFSAKLQLAPSGVIVPGSPEMMGPKKVFVFRNLPMGADQAQRFGIRIGAAYLWQDKRFMYIRDVDVKLSDKALCAQFGVSSSNSWHRTFWSAPDSVAQK